MIRIQRRLVEEFSKDNSDCLLNTQDLEILKIKRLSLLSVRWDNYKFFIEKINIDEKILNESLNLEDYKVALHTL